MTLLMTSKTGSVGGCRVCRSIGGPGTLGVREVLNSTRGDVTGRVGSAGVRDLSHKQERVEGE